MNLKNNLNIKCFQVPVPVDLPVQGDGDEWSLSPDSENLYPMLFKFSPHPILGVVWVRLHDDCPDLSTA